MSEELGHTSGQPPAGLSWGDLIAGLVEDHGSLVQVAWKLIEHASGDDVASIERALRRLRGRGQLDGGVWGQRVLRVFGVPTTIESRLRWMGLYHSPFNDLSLALCLDQLRVWDRPPVSESRARVWIRLGLASCALRQRQFAEATAHIAQAAPPSDAPYDVARVETALIAAYVASREAAPVEPHLDRASELIANGTLSATDRACCRARVVDQRAYQLNRSGDHAGGLALYSALPDEDVHPFASYRRDAGRAYGTHKRGDKAEALRLAERACEHAGDGGYTRLRAMGLLLIAQITGGAVATSARSRALAIAERLDDDELRERCARGAASTTSTDTSSA